MGDDLSLGYKIAASAVIMAFLLSIGLSLMMIGRNLWDKTATQITAPINSILDNDAFYLASYEKPVPVADIWKLVARINNSAATPNGNITSFSIKEQNPNNPNDWTLVSTSVNDLDSYMSEKAYLSWKLNEKTGLYSMEVSLVG